MKKHYLGTKRFTEDRIQGENRIDLSFYYDNERKEYQGGINGTPFILYVTGTNTERLGTASDNEIIEGFLREGYAVCVADYQNCNNVKCPELDYSVQNLLTRLRTGELFEENTPFFGKKCELAFLVPAGFSLARNHVFWSFDKHGADGTLEEIVNIWNHDFRSVKGEKLIYWVDCNGNRKSVQPAFDRTEPVWTDQNGIPDQNGKYIRIKYTEAQTVADCTKADGSPLNMDLAMNIYYPVRPKRKVPVMCLASSADTLAACAAKSDRPHFHGFLLRGYAGVVFDYGYTPMARGDHYGYFDGNNSQGHITGDNVTYSLQFYNGTAINTAAMRYVRYLAETNNTFAFDTNAIGVIGNSKGGWTAFLGQEFPENHTPHRYFKEHQGESRYENGKTEPDGSIRGGEEQPFLKVNNKNLPSRADFIYAGCGGHNSDIFPGHSPMYISCHYNDLSGYENSSSFVSLCRDCNVPAVVSCLDLGHTLCYGNDTRYGFDSYNALFDTAGFFLNGNAVKILYHTIDDSGLHIKFTGSVSRNEINRIRLYNNDGNEVFAEKASSFGNTLWTFTPEREGTITVTVPAKLCGENGAFLGTDTTFEYIQPEIRHQNALATEKKVQDTDLTHCIVRYGEYLMPCEEIFPDYNKVVKIVVTTNISRDGKAQFLNDEFYPNHAFYRGDNGNKIIVENILGQEGFTEADSGRRFRILVSVFDTVSRDIQLSLSSGYSMEEKVFDLNKAIRNFYTKKDKWCDLELDYTVSEPFEKGAKKLVIAVSSTGASEMPLYVGKICVLEKGFKTGNYG